MDYLSRSIRSGETGLIDGGAGENQLEVTPQLWFDRDPSATLDAEAGTAVVSAGDDTHTSSFTNIDWFTLWAVPWTFRGSGADDFVQVLGARMEAQGLGGDDYLLGGARSDVLDGGEGTDNGWGGPGQNTCLDTEVGDCSGYPWDEAPGGARVLGRDASSPAHLAPRRLVSRWLTHRTPVVVR